ncbi:bifunctional 3'-5' exonuclease/DNA polymerase [Anaerosporobacter faecicola]|uniref:bifunctional 3'-5' exonuclease/DNA polymerase n=1 Tax=Anaerosporobacter faecicola TaxID=2718714 RepID=UPI00143B5729|nr:bifunctional 3'-5' exonuclease/DNA polymerase [Anaerosporobacter faecicola]
MEIKNKYECVISVQGIKDYIGNAIEVAFDYETAPDEPFREEDKAALDPHKSHIVGCSFSVKEGTGIYVPIAHLIGTNIDKDEFFAYLREFLSDKRIIKIAHNIAFESCQSYHQGIVIKAPVYDTICAAQMTLKNHYEFRQLKDSGLKTLAKELCGEPLPSFSSVTDGKHFDELDGHDAETVRYGAADSDFSLRLYHKFNEWFDKFMPAHRKIVEELESPTAVYIGIMKHIGVPMNVSLMEQRKIEVETEMAKLREQIAFIIGDVNIGANCGTQAFKDYLYKTLGLPVLKTTASNREAADDMTMTMLKEYCDKHRPELSQLFVLVQEYRKLGKIKSTYIDGYSKYINSVTQRVHPDLFALSTDTGRFNCTKPNCQNMPRKTNDPVGIRNFVKAPDGKVIVSLDFSQIELRVGAFYCRDENMLQTYRENGDIHAQTTAVIFGVSYEEAKDKNAPNYKENRTIAKNCNFGVFYGLFPKGLQGTLKFKAGVEKTIEECEEIIANLKAGYKNLAIWQENTKADAYKNVYTETWIGRRRYLPGIRSEDWSKKSFAERCSMNTPIQGTAADILKMAIARILEGLDSRPWLEPILQIHDELTFIIPEDKLEDAVAFVKECMEVKPFAEFDLPLVAEGAIGHTFGTMEELDD